MRKTKLGVTLSKEECAAIRADVRCRLRQPAEPSQIVAQGFCTVDRDNFLWDRFDDPDKSDAKEKEFEALCKAELLIHTTALEDGRADDYFLDKLDSGLEQYIRNRIYIWKQPVYCPSRYRPRDELSVEELLHKWALHEEVYPDSRRRIRRIFEEEAVYALALALRDAHRARVKREEAAREHCDRFRPGGDLHISFAPARHPENAWGIPCPRDPDPELDTPGSDW